MGTLMGKFKVGDEVRVNSNFPGRKFIGAEGRIIKIEPGDKVYPYLVKAKHDPNLRPIDIWYSPDEIDLIKSSKVLIFRRENG